MLNILTVDHVDNLVYPPIGSEFLNMEEYSQIHDIILKQLQDLDNLGVNLLKDIEEGEIKNKIYHDIIDYTKNNYLVIPNKDYIMNDEELSQTANLLYQFLCVDGFNVIIPRILEQTNIQSIEGFDRLLFHNKNDRNYIKKHIINNLSAAINILLKLQKFAELTDDKPYKELVSRFGNYLELIDFSDCEMFTENYLRPILSKYFAQILWRTLSPVSVN
jgi:hypothetical protein